MCNEQALRIQIDYAMIFDCYLFLPFFTTVCLQGGIPVTILQDCGQGIFQM